MTVTDRTAATDAEFRTRIAAFESAPTPPEIVEARVVEEVARAIYDADPDIPGSFDGGTDSLRDLYRRLAAAAVAAYRAAQDGGAEEAVRRWIVEAASALQSATVISERMHRTGQVEGLNLGNHDRLIREADHLRAALVPQAGDGAR